MSDQTTFFKAIDYIVALCKATVPSGVYVYDGPETGDTGSRRVVQIAYGEGLGEAAVEGDATISNFAMPMETYSISCSITIDDGDTDLADKRAEIAAIFHSLVAAVRADRLLGGLLVLPGFAFIEGFSYVQEQTEDEGSYVVAAFSVRVQNQHIWTP